jgi:hypothetical protein
VGLVEAVRRGKKVLGKIYSKTGAWGGVFDAPEMTSLGHSLRYCPSHPVLKGLLHYLRTIPMSLHALQ